eukprot:CAMPEP_0177572736 /NCGR_PEP_ID=MMETSP0369-20130122/78153_1 /TAXON_ID=447022 ORGANISM="Scrippsiella hangoei-like, Strain SHHI-4" /NCGR_SAMPLE_ID=MMETSP0369 /ASSEMBLY_ACC=CAM_ASM_000364 /LENGTH=51 /DNA_ID=CAMNT_0019060801 /DNA_START=24 /DNA_END=176 /DNA_ORIENTATION=-
MHLYKRWTAHSSSSSSGNSSSPIPTEPAAAQHENNPHELCVGSAAGIGASP